MKKIIFILLLLVLTIGSCRKEIPVPIKPIDFGKTSTGISYVSYPKLNNSVLTIALNTTVGSKYAFQLTDINDDVVLSKGFIANNAVESFNINVKEVPVGLYNISIIDIAGGELKSPILIKQ